MPEFDLQFTVLLVVSGLMIGLMYALIALGFVLVYKATGRDQLRAGRVRHARRADCRRGAGRRTAVLARRACCRSAGMIAFCFGLERVVLRKLLGRPTVAVIMATIGLASLIRRWRDAGLRPGRALHQHAGGRRCRCSSGRSCCRRCSLSAPPSAWCSSPRFTWFFLKTRMGVAMRAVADNQTVSMGMGINVQRYFAHGLGADRHRLRAGRRDLGRHARRGQPVAAGRAEGVPGGDPGRARIRSSARWSAG